MNDQPELPESPKVPSESETEKEALLSFVPGSSVIDIGELRRAQNSTEIEDLDQEAREILEEFESDPEMKADVLQDFDASASNEDMDRIAGAVQIQTEEEILRMQELSVETAAELQEMNTLLIAEDRLLEDPALREQLLGNGESAGEEADLLVTEDMTEEDNALRSALPQADAEGNYDLEDLQSCIDTLLFYSDKPISLKRIKEMLEMSEAGDEPILQAIEALKEAYRPARRGFELAEIAGGYQLRTKAAKAPLLRKLAKVQFQRLSRGAMETLTICAYKQPCTKDDIDQIRGVDSSHFIRTLLDRKLIEVSGRSEAPGRPMIYQTTDTFLEIFGLMDLGGLPPLREIEAMVPQLGAAEEGGEDPRVIQMRKMVSQMKIEANHLDYDSKEDEKILQEIRERVKSIDISTPYLERQKALAEQGITGEEAEALLVKEFGLDQAQSGGEPISDTSGEPAPAVQEDSLSLDEIAEIIEKNSSRDLESELT